MSDWTDLVKKLAGDRQVCNCGHAYYSMTGTAILSGSGEVLHNQPVCQHGCSANQIFAKEDIARRVLAELSK